MNLRSLHDLAETPVWRIWRGLDETLQKRCLVKEVTVSGNAGAVHKQRLANEAEFLKKHAHRRIAAVLNLDQNAGRLILEDAQCTLYQLLEKTGPLPNDLVVNVLTQCLEGLEHLHSHRTAHGMLSAHNVFVDPSGNVKLASFVGYRYESERPTFDPNLKLRYQAPEVIDSNFGDCRPVSDLYALGFLALEMIAGPQFSKLFGFDRSGQPPKWLLWHANPDVKLTAWRDTVPQVANSLAAVVDGLIAKTPKERAFQTAKELREHLSKLGLDSRRVLPMFDRDARDKQAGRVFRMPTRRVGPTLILTPQNGGGESRRFDHNHPFLVSRSEEDGPIFTVPDPSVGKRHALLACQSTHWHVYSLHHPSGVFHNGRKVRIDRRLARGDELRFGDVGFQVDLELQGTHIIKQFDLLARIHAGNGGELYRANWFQPDRPTRTVALRLLPKEFAADRSQIRRFLRAVPEAGKLRHPNVVRILKAGLTRREDDSHWFLAMELMPGGSLRDLLQQTQRPLPTSQVARFGRDIVAALQSAAEFGLLHRNINPSCILFDENGTAKLGDFSLARGEVFQTMHDITRGKLSLGDFQYQAPEVLLGKSQLTNACDQFGLAASMFEALTGRLPLDKDVSMAETITTMCQLDWPAASEFNPAVPAEWDAFLKRALSREPQSRFASIDEFLGVLNTLPVV